ncbi:MAG: aminoacyl-tRNA hydrolase [Sphingobacteriales bacterium]|nr:MAG: aminoacyl-tRNA hydrolase [Sphingobacteriales bacterium]
MDFKTIFSELIIKATRSGGKGGQNVNKVSTRIQLFFDVVKSNGISDEEKKLILNKLKNKLSEEGVLLIDVQEDRTQLGNKKIALIKLEEVLTNALKKDKKRIKTAVSAGAKKKRLTGKKILGEKKQLRQKKYSQGEE